MPENPPTSFDSRLIAYYLSIYETLTDKEIEALLATHGILTAMLVYKYVPADYEEEYLKQIMAAAILSLRTLHDRYHDKRTLN